VFHVGVQCRNLAGRNALACEVVDGSTLQSQLLLNHCQLAINDRDAGNLCLHRQ